MMKQGPPKNVETIVALLTPPARREEVLGDLHERYASPRQYVVDAIRAVPLVVASQIRRTSDLGGLLLEAFALYLSFLVGASRASSALRDQPRALSLLIPTAVALVALRFVDAYTSGGKRSPLKSILGATIAVAFAFLSETALSIAKFEVGLSSWALFRGGGLAVAAVSMLRIAFPTRASRLEATPAAGEQATPLEAIRRKSTEFETKIRRRNLREYLAAVFVLAFCSVNLARTYLVGARVGSALIVAGVLYVMYQLHARGSAKSAPVDASLATYLDFHRRELERQRDLLRRIWSWYLGPLIPGFLVLVVSGAIAHPRPWIVAYAISAFVFFLLVAKLNRQAARKLQREIDELDGISPQSS
jgi:hypothetical protein